MTRQNNLVDSLAAEHTPQSLSPFSVPAYAARSNDPFSLIADFNLPEVIGGLWALV